MAVMVGVDSASGGGSESTDLHGRISQGLNTCQRPSAMGFKESAVLQRFAKRQAKTAIEQETHSPHGRTEPLGMQVAQCRPKQTSKKGVATGGKRGWPYLFFWLLGESFFPSSATLRFRGSGLWTKVHSCLWNSHSTHSAAPSCTTQRLLRLRQASQGLSLRVRMLATWGTVEETGLPTTRFSLPGGGFCCLRGRAAAMGMGVCRGMDMEGCIATAVMMSSQPGSPIQGREGSR